MSHFSLPCIWKMSFLNFVSWVSNYPFIVVERKTLRINICLLHLLLTLIQVLIHSIHCLETSPLFFLKFQVFSYLDCGFLLLIFVCLFGSNTFIISSFNFSECTVILSDLSKRSYHFFLPGTSFPGSPCPDLDQAMFWKCHFAWRHHGTIFHDSPRSYPLCARSHPSVTRKISPGFLVKGCGILVNSAGTCLSLLCHHSGGIRVL